MLVLKVLEFTIFIRRRLPKKNLSAELYSRTDHESIDTSYIFIGSFEEELVGVNHIISAQHYTYILKTTKDI